MRSSVDSVDAAPKDEQGCKCRAAQLQHQLVSAKEAHAVSASRACLSNAFSSHLCMCMAADGFGLRLLEAGEVCEEVGEDTSCMLPAVHALEGSTH